MTEVMENKIVFRADANPHIGMGHVMRCLSLADAFKKAGEEVCFVTAGNEAQSLIESRGYRDIVLGSDHRDMEAETDKWPAEQVPKLIVVDSYHVTPAYLSALRSKSRLVYLDDLASFAYPSDVVVNYNVYWPDMDYESLYREAGVSLPKLLLGPGYAPIREMFKGIPKKTQSKEVRDVLISTGGSDEFHIALDIMKALCKKKEEGRTYHFLIGAMNGDRDELFLLSGQRKDIVVHENVSDMRSLICGMDIIVSAAGSTLYEICACGVPFITYVLADNQIRGAMAFERLGLAVNAGDMRKVTDRAGVILSEVDKLSSDHGRRCKTGLKMQDLVDGNGADRLANALMNG